MAMDEEIKMCIQIKLMALDELKDESKMFASDIE